MLGPSYVVKLEWYEFVLCALLIRFGVTSRCRVLYYVLWTVLSGWLWYGQSYGASVWLWLCLLWAVSWFSRSVRVICVVAACCEPAAPVSIKLWLVYRVSPGDIQTNSTQQHVTRRAACFAAHVGNQLLFLLFFFLVLPPYPFNNERRFVYLFLPF